MVITYYGAFCFKIQSKDTILVFDPPSKKSDFKTPRFQAGLVLISQDHKDHNGFESIGFREKDKEPFLINSPGEYEIQEVVIRSLAILNFKKIFLVSLENLSFCFLGDIEENELTKEAQEFLADIDVLFVPASRSLAKVINQIEPKIIIPMCLDKKDLGKFFEEMGGKKPAALDKFTFKKKDITDKKGELVLLDPFIG